MRVCGIARRQARELALLQVVDAVGQQTTSVIVRAADNDMEVPRLPETCAECVVEALFATVNS